MSDKVLNGPDQRLALMDSARWVCGLFSFILGVYLYHEQFAEYGLEYRILALLPCILIGGYFLLSTVFGKKIFDLSKESIIEARKVVWPTKAEANQTTLAVLAVVVVAGIVLWLIDIVLNWLTAVIVG